MLRPWVTLIDSTLRYGLRIGIKNFRFELGVWIGGFTHCDTYTEDEYVKDFVEGYRGEIVRQVAEKQAITS
jgi:hypothetical protein